MSGFNLSNFKEPACFFDKESFTLMKIGEKLFIENMYNQYLDAYLAAGNVDMAVALTYVDLPHDQELIDNVLNISGYCKNLMYLVKEQRNSI